jgi:serine phosphatase RsbU (regulator of sigma subunit)
MSATLTVVKGPNPGQVFRFEETCDIGRADDCQICLRSLTVSRRHARVIRAGMGYQLEHLSAINPTLLNGERIQGLAPLKGGDELTLGEVLLRFDLVVPAIRPSFTPIPPSEESRDGGPQIVRAVSSARSLLDDMEQASSPEDIRRLVVGLKTVVAVSKALTGSLESEDLLAEILNRTMEVFPETSHAAVLGWDDAMELAPRATKSRRKNDQRQIQISRTVLRHVVKGRQAVLSRDARQDQRFAAQQSVALSGVRSIMSAPLIYREEVLGVLYLDSDVLGAYGPNDLDLLNAVADQCATALGTANLHRELLRRQKLEQDLEVAQEIQRSFLPSATPRVSGYEFWASYQPALSIGGDFYDFIPLPDGRVAVVIADVSGKGVPAALYMARLTRDLRHYTLSLGDPGAVLTEMNRVVIEANRPNVFVTMAYLLLEPDLGRIRVANAGHLPPILRRTARGSAKQLDGESGMPLGIMPDTSYEVEDYQLELGDTVLLYTDGVNEAIDAKKELFGIDRVLSSLAECESGAKSVIESLLQAVAVYSTGAQQYDDTTLVALSLTGDQATTPAHHPAIREPSVTKPGKKKR